VVLDNLDRPAEQIARDWLPADLPGHLIVTSRTPQEPRPLLELFPVEVATSFLLERTARADAPAARAIAEVLGGLRLALEQAAAYLIENPWRSRAGSAERPRSGPAEGAARPRSAAPAPGA
jgi:hypothetical protein